MLGSPQHQQTAMDTASGLASRDYNDYMKNAMGMYEKGLSGMGDVEKRGFDTTNDFSKMIQDYFKSKSGLEYEGQASKNQGQGDMMKTLMSLFGQFAPMMM